jgi:hypothetical protein
LFPGALTGGQTRVSSEKRDTHSEVGIIQEVSFVAACFRGKLYILSAKFVCISVCGKRRNSSKQRSLKSSSFAIIFQNMAGEGFLFYQILILVICKTSIFHCKCTVHGQHRYEQVNEK